MLYSTNTLGFERPEALMHFKAHFKSYFGLTKHFDICVDEMSDMLAITSHPTCTSTWQLDTLIRVMARHYRRWLMNLRLRFIHHQDHADFPANCGPITTFLNSVESLQMKTEIILPANLEFVAGLCTEVKYLTFTTESSDGVSDNEGEDSDDENYGIALFPPPYIYAWGDPSYD